MVKQNKTFVHRKNDAHRVDLKEEHAAYKFYCVQINNLPYCVKGKHLWEPNHRHIAFFSQ